LATGENYLKKLKQEEEEMRKINLLACLAVVLLGTTLMSGQATRTWVSGVGDDANPCSRTAPCKTFAGAISKTAPGGEIDALDPGGFGALTITKSITLDGGGGQVASVLVAGTNGIVVAAGAADIVIIRNMRLDGLLGGGNANAGINGIRFISGKALHIENCDIFGFNNNGIDIAKADGGKVFVTNTVVQNNAKSGISSQNTVNIVSVTIKDSTFDGNGFVGVLAREFSNISVTNTTSSGNAFGYVSQASAAGLSETMTILNSMAAGNTIGIQTGGNGGTDTVNISGVGLFNNGVGINNGSVVKSWGNNFNLNGGTTTAPNLTPQ